MYIPVRRQNREIRERPSASQVLINHADTEPGQVMLHAGSSM
jgi:hypothetical protein